MAFTSFAALGSGQSKSAATTIVLTTSAAAAVGDLVVVQITKDNSGTTTGATSEVTNVTDSAGNTYTKGDEYTSADGAANAGTVAAIWYSRITSALGSGGTITATFTASVTAKAISACKVTTAAAIAVIGSSGVTVTGSADCGNITLGTYASREYFWVRMQSIERDFSAGLYTASTGATAFAENGTTGGSSVSNQQLYAEYRIATEAGWSSDPVNLNASLREQAGVAIGFYESAPAGDMIGTANLSVAATGTLAGSGALAGTSPLSIGASATIQGFAAIAGTAALSFTATGTLADLPASGVLAGTANFAITAVGTLTGSGALTGTAPISFAPTGTLAGAGALAGTAPLSIGATGTLQGLVFIQGEASLSMSASGVLTGSGALAGAAPISFTPTGTLRGTGALAGTADLSITATATGAMISPMVGTANLTFTATGTLDFINLGDVLIGKFLDVWEARQIMLNKIASNIGASGFTSFTPAVTTIGGPVTTYTINTAEYRLIGKLVFVAYVVTIDVNGSGSGTVRVDLPFTAATKQQMIPGIETDVSGLSLQGSIAAGSTYMDISQYNAVYPGNGTPDGMRLVMTGSYEKV